MLSPDVVNIKSSIRQEVTVKSGRLTDNELDTQLKANIGTLGNIYGLKIVVPSNGPLNNLGNIKKVLTEDTEYYVVEKGFDMSIIFDKTFHYNFIASGDLSLSSVNKDFTMIPCRTINHNNNLLSVTLRNDDGLSDCLAQILTKKYKTRDNYHHFQQNTNLLNLKSSQVENIKSHSSVLPTPVVCTWSHPDKNICPSSLANYLVDRGMQVQVKNIMVDMHIQKNLQIPSMEKEDFCDWDDEYVADVEEWLGAVCLQLPTETISAPSPCMSEEMLTCIQASGLFTTNTILDMISTLAKSMINMPWVSLSLLGPSHGTVFRGKKCLKTSDSVITIIMTRKGEWVMRQSKSVDHSHSKPSKYS